MRASNVFFPMAIGFSLALSLMVFPAGVRGESVVIEFLGLGLEYDGTDIYDSGGAAGFRDSGSVGDADPLTLVSFSQDDVVKSVDMQDVYADVLIKGVFDIPAIGQGGGVSSTGNADDFGIDIFDPVEDWWLRLNINDIGVAFARHPLIGDLAIVATGAVSSVEGQNLPGGLSIGTPITILLSSNNFTVESAGGKLTKFEASGTGSIVGVPEPSTMVGLLTGALAFVVSAWRRRRR